MTSSQNKFVLPDLSITINLSKYGKHCVSCVRVKKYLMTAFIKMNGS